MKPAEYRGMSDEHPETAPEDGADDAVSWPVKGPSTPQQAIVAIAVVFFLGLVLGFLLAKTF